MTVRVLAVHKACVQPLRGRGASPALALARVETPVALQEVDPSRFERGQPLLRAAANHAAVDPWLRDGVAWQPLRRNQVPGYEDAETISPGEFLAWLTADPPAPSVAVSLERAFAATPLVPRLCSSSPQFRRLSGAEPVDGDRLGPLGLDERAACAEAVRRIAGEDILLAGRYVLVPFRPLLRYAIDGRRTLETLTITPDAYPGETVLSLADRPQVNGLMRGAVRVAFDDRVSRFRKELPGQGHDADLRVMAGLVPAEIRPALQPFVDGRQELPTGVTLDQLRDADARLADLERRGAFGIIRDDELPDAFEAMRAAARLVNQRAFSALQVSRYRAFDRALEYCERIALPRLRTAPAVDAEALAGLAP